MLSHLALFSGAASLLASVSALPVDTPAQLAVRAQQDNVTSDPYNPSGGLNTSLNIIPKYDASSTAFDFQSINLALNQEWIELDLFHNGLARFSAEEFEAVGITAQDRFLIEFYADQETGHARLLGNMLGPRASLQCEYQYPYTTVSEFIDFCQKLTRWGESGVYGFLGHLSDQSVASLLTQSIVTEARQQFGFRALQGLRPITEYFVPGLPQAFAWTLLQPYIKSCPSHNPHIQFQIFPELRVNTPDVLQSTTGFKASLGGTNFTEPISPPGRQIQLSWDGPGKVAAYNQSDELYKTSVHKGIGAPAHLAWISQLNLTYTPLSDISLNKNGSGSAVTYVPNFTNLFPQDDNAPVNSNQSVLAGTIFVAVTDSDTFFTSYNLTGINAHVVAGPAMYQFD